MSELCSNHSGGRVELIILQDNEARGKKFVATRGFIFASKNKSYTSCVISTNIVYYSWRGKCSLQHYDFEILHQILAKIARGKIRYRDNLIQSFKSAVLRLVNFLKLEAFQWIHCTNTSMNTNVLTNQFSALSPIDTQKDNLGRT